MWLCFVPPECLADSLLVIPFLQQVCGCLFTSVECLADPLLVVHFSQNVCGCVLHLLNILFNVLFLFLPS